MRSRKLIGLITVFLISASIGTFLFHVPHAYAQQVPYLDDGFFVVTNTSVANGTSAPRDLIAGHWGNEYNFTVPCASVRYQLYEQWDTPRQQLDFSVNATVPAPMVVYLDLGNSTLETPIYLDVAYSC